MAGGAQQWQLTMGYDSSIKATFAGDLSGLKQFFNEAQAEGDKLNQKMGNRIQDRLVGGLIGAEALNKLKEFAGEAIKDAQSIRDAFEASGQPIDDDTKSLAQFGDALDNAHKSAISFTGSLLSFFTEGGEGLGEMINDLRGVSREQVALAEESGHRADLQEKALLKLRQEQTDTAKILDLRRQTGEVLKHYAEVGLAPAQKLLVLKQEAAALDSKISAFQGDTVNKGKMELELAKNLTAQKELEYSITEKIHAGLEKSGDTLEKLFTIETTGNEKLADLESRRVEAAKNVAQIKSSDVRYGEAQAELSKIDLDIAEQKRAIFDKQSLSLQDQVEEARILSGASQDDTTTQGQKLEIFRLQTEQKKRQAEIDDIVASRKGDLSDADKRQIGMLDRESDQLGIQIQQKQALIAGAKDQAAAEQDVNKQMEDQAKTLVGIAGIRGSRQFGRASDEELKEQLRRDKAAQVNLRGKSSTDLSALLEGGRLGGETQNIEKELAFRDKLRSNLKTGGVEGARRQFQGDPLVFDRLVEQFGKQGPKTDRMVGLLTNIDHKLGNAFTNQ